MTPPRAAPAAARLAYDVAPPRAAMENRAP